MPSPVTSASTPSGRFTLEQLHIPQPCHVDWEAMAGDARTRFCGHCQKHVHDLSARTRAEAEGLLAGAGEHLCVQYRVTADGRVITADAPPRGRAGRRSWAALSMIVAAALTLVGCKRESDSSRIRGDIDGPGDVRLAGSPMPILRTAGMIDTSRVITGDVGPTTRPAATAPASTQPTQTIRGERAAPATRPTK